MVRRNATTLTEVLIAIFIMGIGLMAILALFPLGAVQMAQALKDQRAAEAAGNAAAMARIIWKQACEADATFMGATSATRPMFREGTTARNYPRAVQRFVMAMDDPNFNDLANSTPNPISYPGGPQIPAGPVGVPGGFIMNPAPGVGGVPQLTDMTPMPLTGPQANQSSYAVFVDPVGWIVNSANPAQQCWLGYSSAVQQPTNAGNKTGLIARRPLYIRNPTTGTPATVDWLQIGFAAPVNGLQRIAKQVSLMDDMSFNFDGTPDLDNDPRTTPTTSPAETGTALQRVGRYSWAYMFRRTRNKDFRFEVDVSVIVYSGRTFDVPTDERSYLGTTDWDSRLVNLAYSGNRPSIKRGYWILDSTVFNSNGQPDPQARFYRVVNVDDATPGVLKLELQTPIAPSGPRTTPRVFTVLDNVVEVFQVGFISPTTPPRNITDDQEY